MKQPSLFFLLILISISLRAQDKEKTFFSTSADYFYGNIVEHNPEISHLITGHPEGAFISFNLKTFGTEEWERQYNSPDWGFSFLYQDMKNQYLGDNYALYAHYNFYLLKRNLVFSVGTGLNYNTNPYDPETNFRNNVYGSQFLSSTYIKLNYTKNNICGGLGLQGGLMFIHYSNGNLKAPNTSTNTLAFNLGVNYNINYEDYPTYTKERNGIDYSEKIKFNVAFRTGVNESDIIGLGQHPFYVFSAFADKRLNYKSTLQAGGDLFLSHFLKDYIKYQHVAFPEDGTSGEEDYKRVGVFVGHELRITKMAFVSQIGYYVYWPYEFENRIYLRLGLKRYFVKDYLFAAITLKSHWAQAEAIEFGLGIRI